VELQQFITDYGYLAILIGTFLEGETIVILSGIAAHLGYLEAPLVILAAFTGSFCGDQFYFLLGRRFGPRIINRRLSWQEGAAKVYRILQRHQDFLILTFRFYYGVRNVTPFVLGASPVSWVRFLLLNAIGAIVWATSFCYAGYFFGEVITRSLEDFHRYEMQFWALLVAIGLGIWLASLIRRRRRALGSHPAPAASAPTPDPPPG
jgi:membrane protein DedA with SNARE-associated domain